MNKKCIVVGLLLFGLLILLVQFEITPLLKIVGTITGIVSIYFLLAGYFMNEKQKQKKVN